MVIGRTASGDVNCVQIISLNKETVQKADIPTDRHNYGVVTGSFACIQMGEAHEPKIFAEGVETALSLAEAGIEGSIYSMFDGSNLKHVSSFLESNFKEIEDALHIIIAADQNGNVLHPSHKAVSDTIQGFLKKGRMVEIARPDSTYSEQKVDWNDVLKSEGAATLKEIFRQALITVEGYQTQDWASPLPLTAKIPAEPYPLDFLPE
jgi:hypothetical protein